MLDKFPRSRRFTLGEWLVRRLKPTLWVSGHTYSPFDYRVGETRVVINPCGYVEATPLPGFSVMKTVEV